MALPGPAKVLFDLGLRSSRLPLDAMLHLAGRSDSPLQLEVDRLEAGVRTAAGIFFDDDELRAQGERGLSATRDRETAAGLRADDGPAPASPGGPER
jgi:hypothetical protein